MGSDDAQAQYQQDELRRPDARALFLAALEEPVYTGKVYHLVGRGGIGKSYELRWIDRQAKRLQSVPGSDLIESGLLDLTHTRYHQPLLFMGSLARRIARSLPEPGAGHFEPFFVEADRYLNAGGEAGGEVSGLVRVRDRFLDCYAAATDGRRLVLTVDTFERLDPRIPEVEPYNFRTLARFEAWFVELLAALPNTLTVIAGRVRPRQTEELRRRLGPRFARRVVLPPLTALEVREFLQGEQVPDPEHDAEWYERMYEVSGGLPVRLIVAIEIARAGGFDPDQLPPSLRGGGPVDLDRLGQDFAEAFVGSLYTSNPQLARLIELACYLRKGLHANLVQELLDGDAGEVLGLLEQLKGFGFVKVSGDGVLTLHDDVYDLLENRLGIGSADTWRSGAIAFLERAQSRLNTEIGQLGMTMERLGRLRTLQVDRLYYQLAREPTLRGYQNYCELAYAAIFARDEEFDTQLQDELARFYDPNSQSGQAYRGKLEQGDFPWERLCYDEAVRWAFRRLHAPDSPQDGYKEPLALVERVEQDYGALIAADALARCALEVVRLEPLGLTKPLNELGQTADRYARLIASLQEIEDAAAAAAATDERSIHQYRRQQSRFLRAYALNNWGYVARRQNLLHTAVERYTAAIEAYKTLGDEIIVPRATSLNNLGNALRLQGNLELALVCIDESIALQRTAGSRYREAAGHSTRALLLFDMDDVLGAQQSVARVRALVADFPGTRNAAFASEASAELSRRLAVKFADDPEESEQLYREAIRLYETFRDFFDAIGFDSGRRISARRGLGSTYRSRGHSRRLRGEDGGADMETARRLFREAIALLGDEPLRLIDMSEDIAFTYVLEGRYEEALAELAATDRHVPEEFKVRGAGVTETATTREQRGFWLQLSKVELQRGLCHLALRDAETACADLLRAFAYVLRYSPESPQIQTYREVAGRQLLRQYRAAGEGPRELAALRQRAYLIAQRLGTREAFFKLEQVFDTVEQMLKLL